MIGKNINNIPANQVPSFTPLALSLDEVADELQVDVSDVNSLIESGDLYERNIGGKRRVPTQSLLDYLSGGSCAIRQPSSGGKHLIIDILDIVLEGKKASCRKLSSYKWYCDIAKHIRTGFCGKYIEDLTQKDILNFMTHVSKNKDGKLMSHHLLAVLKQLLKIIIKYSLMKGYISINPFDFMATIPCGKKSSPKDRVLSRKTVVKLIKALDHSPTFKPMVILMLHTGMRIGEALALHWSDIDEDNQIIHIHHSLTLVYDEDENGNLINKRYEIGDTKTVCSVRDITVDKETLGTRQRL